MQIFVYSYFEKGCGKKRAATIPEGNMEYDQYTLPGDCSCRSYFYCFPLALANAFPWPFVPILSNFFEKKKTQNHPQCLSGLSRALFPKTFLDFSCISKVGIATAAESWKHLLEKNNFCHPVTLAWFTITNP